MANAFSFAPDPAYGWGGTGAYMGRALFSALTNGMGIQQMWDQTRRLTETTPSYIANQNAGNFAGMMGHNMDNIGYQSQIGTALRGLGMDPAASGYMGIAQHLPSPQPTAASSYAPPAPQMPAAAPAVGSPGATVDSTQGNQQPISPVFNDFWARLLSGNQGAAW